jgi:hypothetical protein
LHPTMPSRLKAAMSDKTGKKIFFINVVLIDK